MNLEQDLQEAGGEGMYECWVNEQQRASSVDKC